MVAINARRRLGVRGQTGWSSKLSDYIALEFVDHSTDSHIIQVHIDKRSSQRKLRLNVTWTSRQLDLFNTPFRSAMTMRPTRAVSAAAP